MAQTSSSGNTQARRTFYSSRPNRILSGAVSAAMLAGTFALTGGSVASADVTPSDVPCASVESHNYGYRESTPLTRLNASFNALTNDEKTIEFTGLFQVGVTPYDLYGGRYSIVVDERIAEYVESVVINGYGGDKTALKVADNTWQLPFMALETQTDEDGNSVNGFLSQTWIGDAPNWFTPMINLTMSWEEVLEAAGIDKETDNPITIEFRPQFKAYGDQTEGDIISNAGGIAYVPFEPNEKISTTDNFLTSVGMSVDPATSYDAETYTLTLDTYVHIKPWVTYNTAIGPKPYQLVLTMDPAVAKLLASAKVQRIGLAGVADVLVDSTTLNTETGELVINVFGESNGGIINVGEGIVESGRDTIFSTALAGSYPFASSITLTFSEDLYSLLPEVEGRNAGVINLPFSWEMRSYRKGQDGHPTVNNSYASVILPLADSDGDTIPDRLELSSGYNSDPCVYDTDGDGVNDGTEIRTNLTDPTIAAPTLSQFSTQTTAITQTSGQLAFTDLTTPNLPGRILHLQRKNDSGEWEDVSTATVAEDGSFTLDASSLNVGDVVRVTVQTVEASTIPDGATSTTITQAAWDNPEVSNEITVSAALADALNPVYDEGVGTAGSTITIPAPTFETQDADSDSDDSESEGDGSDGSDDSDDAETVEATGTTFALGTSDSDNALPENVTVTVDETTGAITVEVPEGTEVKDYVIPVVVTYSDASTETVEVSVSVETAASAWERTHGEAGSGLKATDASFAYGTTIDQDALKTLVDGGSDLPAGATVSTTPVINTQPTDTAGHTQSVNVTVTFADGSTLTTTTPATVTVGNASDVYDPVFTGFDVEVGQELNETDLNAAVSNSDPSTALPDGTTVALASGSTFDSSTTGEKTVNLTVTYPDGSTDQISGATINVVDNSEAAHKTPQTQTIVVDYGATVPALDTAITNKDDLEATSYTAVEADAIDTTKPGNYTRQVTVTYSDNSTDTVNVTVRVRSAADSFNPTANTTGVQAELGSQPGATEAEAAVNTAGLPAGTTYVFKETVNTSAAGTVNATVVVTYPDGTTDEVPVTITVVDSRTEADKHAPEAATTPVSVELNSTPGADEAKSAVNTDGLPQNTTYAFKDEVDTSAAGSVSAVVVVTYPDNSIDEVPVTISVVDSRTDAEKYDPAANENPLTVQLDSTLDEHEARYAVDTTGLPTGTTYAFKETVDTSSVGEKTATVVVTYPDTSTDEVDVKINVVDSRSDADKYDPSAVTTPVEVELGSDLGEAEAKAAVDTTGLPEDATYAFEGTVDTSSEGEKDAVVVVTYPDGSEDRVPATVTVVDSRSDADKYDPSASETAVSVELGSALTDDQAKAAVDTEGLPDGSTYAFKEPVDTTSAGVKDAVVVVTYPDGTTDEVVVKITVVDSRSDADKYDPEAAETAVEVELGSDLGAAEAEAAVDTTGLPEDATYSFKEPVDTTTAGVKDAVVVVTYPDGTTDEVAVKITVVDSRSDADKYDPSAVTTPVEVELGSTPGADAAESAVDTEGLPDGSTYAFKEPVDTTSAGEKDAVVVVTYPDGTTDEVAVKITVVDTNSDAEDQATDDQADQTDDQSVSENVVKVKKDKPNTLPVTGSASSGIAAGGIVIGLISAFAAIFRRRKSNDE